MTHFDAFELNAERQLLSRAPWGGDSHDITNCRTLQVVAVARIKRNSEGKAVIEIMEGAVTGYESFYVSDLLSKTECNPAGFYWCAGTPGRWDSLRISAEEFNALCAKLRELGYGEKGGAK